MLEIGKAYENNAYSVVHIEGQVKADTAEPCVYDSEGNWYNQRTGSLIWLNSELDVDDLNSISDHEPVEVEKKPDPAELRVALTAKAKTLMGGDNPTCLCFGELYDHVAADIDWLAEISTHSTGYVMACLADDLMGDLD